MYNTHKSYDVVIDGDGIIVAVTGTDGTKIKWTRALKDVRCKSKSVCVRI